MARNLSLDGLGEHDSSSGVPFAVPGERYENLPAGGFAGMGSRGRSFDYLPYAPERATGGDGQFAGFDPTSFQGGSRMIAGMGDLFSDLWTQTIQPALQAGGAAVVGTAVQKASQLPGVQAQIVEAAKDPVQKKIGEFVLKNWIPIAAGTAGVLVLVIYLAGKSRRK